MLLLVILNLSWANISLRNARSDWRTRDVTLIRLTRTFNPALDPSRREFSISISSVVFHFRSLPDFKMDLCDQADSWTTIPRASSSCLESFLQSPAVSRHPSQEA
jgi:hypothetical protein